MPTKKELLEIAQDEHLDDGAFKGKRTLGYGYDPEAGEPRRFRVNADGEQIVEIPGMVGFNIGEFDELAFAYPNDTTMVITYKLATVTVATLTITYTDNTQEKVSSIVRS